MRPRPAAIAALAGLSLAGLALALATGAGLGVASAASAAPTSSAPAPATGAPNAQANSASPGPDGRSIVVTYAILGSVVSDLVGDRAQVSVLMPNGVDPHDWSPSAKDVQAVEEAGVVVANGLGLEAGLEAALTQAASRGVVVFRATDHVVVRRSGVGTGDPAGSSPAPTAGGDGVAADPHFWTDPVSMRMVVAALADTLASAGVDVADRATDLERRLDALDAETRATIQTIPAANRLLVTGHESMGYFADRYGLTLVGAVVPGLTSQGEVSAGQLADLKALILARGVKTIFAEIGTPVAVVDAVARETGATVVQMPTHALPPDGSYFSLIRLMARDVADALRCGGAACGAPSAASPGAGVFAPLVDPFLGNEFMLRALVAGILVSIACAIVGTFVVLRGLAFIGDALAHGVLPGIATALLLGLPGMVGAAAGALAMIAGVSLITRRSRLSSDTAIGLLFVAMLALGVVIVSRSTAFAGDLVAILFGQILGTSMGGLATQAVATVVVFAVSLVCARPFLLLSFDPEQADVAGFPSRRYHAVMLVLIALTVIVSFQTVGTLLVFGMLLAPAGAGALLAHRIEAMMVWGAAIGSVATYVGLLVSYHFDVAAGAAIVLAASVIFFVVLALTNLRDRVAASPRVPEAPADAT